jgi:hypothetical protein
MGKKLVLTELEIKNIINLYTVERDNIKNISVKMGIGPKIIRRVLTENNIKLDGIENRFYRILTREHKQKISKSLIGKTSPMKGKKMNSEKRIKNYEIQLGIKNFSLSEFTNYGKFRFIMRWVSRYKISTKGEEYVYSFIKKIYNDQKFN